MPNDSNDSGVGETCLACKKIIRISKSVKCTVCQERCHMTCVKPQVSEEIKAAMVQNKLIQFVCPTCLSVVETYKGKINSRFMEYATKLHQNSQQMKEAQQELDNQRIQLNEQFRQLQLENTRLRAVSQTDAQTIAKYKENIQQLQLKLDKLIEENRKLTSNTDSSSYNEFQIKLQELQVKLNEAYAENENLRKIKDDLSRNAKRQRNNEGNIIFNEQTHGISELIKDLINQSEQRTQSMIDTFKNSLKSVTDNFQAINQRLDKLDGVTNTQIQSQPISNITSLSKKKSTVNVPEITKKASGTLTNYRFNIRNAAPSLKIIFDQTNIQLLKDVILPKFRLDTTLMSLNLINVIENNFTFILTFKTKEDVTSAKSHITSTYGNNIIIEDVTPYTPTIKIVGMFLNPDITPEKLTEQIINFNSEFKLTTENFKVTQIYSNGIQQTTKNAIAEIDAQTFQSIINVGRLFINMKNCKVYENIDLLQCSKCQVFGHLKKYCKKEKPICANCSEEHLTAECKIDRANFKCINCMNSKLTKINHHTLNPNCPSRIARLEGIKLSLKSQIEDITQKAKLNVN